MMRGLCNKQVLFVIAGAKRLFTGIYAQVMAEKAFSSAYNVGDGEKLRDYFRKNKPLNAKKKLNDYKKRAGVSLPHSDVKFLVIGTGCYGSAKTIALFAEHSGYMFNCGDGSYRQMVALSSKIWPKMEQIFLTHQSWSRMGGLLEMCATLEVANPDIKTCLHGYGYLNCTLDVTKRMFGTDMCKGVVVAPPEEKYKDHVLSVENVRLADKTDPDSDNKAACVFKLQFTKPKRRCDAAKLKKLCLRAGPWIAELMSSGEPQDVDGRIVTPDDILHPQQPAKSALVIDCPSMNHMESLIGQADRLRTDEDKQPVTVVIHLTPDHIYHTPEYQSWMSAFDDMTKHIVVSETSECISVPPAWEQQVHLNLIDEQIFPLPYPQPLDNPIPSIETEQSVLQEQQVVSLSAGMFYHLTKNEFGQSTAVPDRVKESAFNYFASTEHVLKEISLINKSDKKGDTRDYPIITFLGTASSQSSGVRNTTGIVIQTSPTNIALLDCGPGTFLQLQTRFGPDETRNILRNLSMIFISHGHTDHHAGLLSFLSARKAEFGDEPLPQICLLAPIKLRGWFHHLNQVFPDSMASVRYVPCPYLKKNTSIPPKPEAYNEKDPKSQFMSIYLSKEEISRLPSELGLSILELFQVRHAYGLSCFGIKLGSEDWTIAYSGDTMPCQELITAAQDVDLLIHEATFDDSLVKDAELKTHSTTGQVMEVAEACRAKFTILTHFSPRYPRAPLPSTKLLQADNIGMAFDFMSVRFRDLHKITMVNLHDVLFAMYPDYMSSKRTVSRTIEKLREEGQSVQEIAKQINRETIKLQEEQQRRKRHLSEDQSGEVANNDLGEPESKMDTQSLLS